MKKMNQKIIKGNSQKAISSKNTTISKKRMKFLLVAIVAFLEAKANLFERGSLSSACRKYAYLVDIKTKASTLIPYVSNIKYYLGLNNESFNANKIFYELVDLTSGYSIDKLITIVNNLKLLSDDINCLDYVKEQLK